MNCLKVVVLRKTGYFHEAVSRNGLGSSLTSICFGGAGSLSDLPSSLTSLICSAASACEHCGDWIGGLIWAKNNLSLSVCLLGSSSACMGVLPHWGETSKYIMGLLPKVTPFWAKFQNQHRLMGACISAVRGSLTCHPVPLSSWPPAARSGLLLSAGISI